MPIFNQGYELEAPGMRASNADKLGWVKRAVAAGEQYIRDQKGYPDLNISRDIISGSTPEHLPRSLSRVRVNRPKRQIREIVGTLANLRPVFNFRSDNSEWYEQSTNLNTMATAWWHNTFFDRRLKETLQFAATDGLGWVGLSWDPNFWCPGRGDIRATPYGAQEVLPIEIGEDHDIQRATAVVIRKSMPTSQVRALYPKMRDLIKPDATNRGAMKQGARVFQRYLAPVFNVFGVGGEGGHREQSGPWATTTLYHIYIRDFSINTSGDWMKMGAANWEYDVPSVGMMIPDEHLKNDDGTPKLRKATEEDARIYPFRRLVIATDTVIISDGSSPWWHGRVPLVPFHFDKWPWDYLPYSLVRDVASIAASNNTLLRAIDDAAKARIRPPLAYDANRLAKALMQRLDTRKEGETVGVDMSQGIDNMIRPLLPAEYYKVESWIPQHIEQMEARSDYLIGVQDFTALAKAKQIPAGDTVQAFLQASGPLLTDMTRTMEQSMRELGELWKGLAFQFYSTPRKVQILGRDNVEMIEMDFNPTNMIPSHMPYEQRKDDKEQPVPSTKSLAERAKHHLNSFYMYVTPNSLHQIMQMSRKLLFLQLWRSGFPIDPWSVMEELDIDGFGPPPKGTSNMIERWKAWQRMKIEEAIEAANAMNAAGGGQGVPGAGSGSGVGGNASGTPGQAGSGRPPSAQAPPKIEAKGDMRPVISESG